MAHLTHGIDVFQLVDSDHEVKLFVDQICLGILDDDLLLERLAIAAARYELDVERARLGVLHAEYRIVGLLLHNVGERLQVHNGRAYLCGRVGALVKRIVILKIN